MSDEETQKLILEKRNEGKVCVMTIDGLLSMNVDEFISQPADGILYDLNRGIETTLTIMPEKRWINDLAVAVTIKALKKRIEELSSPEPKKIPSDMRPSDEGGLAQKAQEADKKKWFNAPFSYFDKHGLVGTAPLKEKWNDALRDPFYVISLTCVLMGFVFALILVLG